MNTSNKESDKRERMRRVVLVLYCSIDVLYDCNHTYLRTATVDAHRSNLLFMTNNPYARCPSEVSLPLSHTDLGKMGSIYQVIVNGAEFCFLFFRQIALADLTIINKTDLVNETELLQLRDTVR